MTNNTTDLGKTIIPYNIIRYYENNKLKKIEWVDPIDKKSYQNIWYSKLKNIPLH